MLTKYKAGTQTGLILGSEAKGKKKLSGKEEKKRDAELDAEVVDDAGVVAWSR